MSPQMLLKATHVTPLLFAERRLAFQNNTADWQWNKQITLLCHRVTITVGVCPTVKSLFTNTYISEDRTWVVILKSCLESPSGRPPVTSLTFSILVWTETPDPGVSRGLGSILLQSAPLELLTTKCSLCPNAKVKLKSKTIWAERQQPKSASSTAGSPLEAHETWSQYSWRLHQKTGYLSFLFLSVNPPKDTCQNNSLLSLCIVSWSDTSRHDE